MLNVRLYDVPIVPGMEITRCLAEARGKNEVRVVYTLKSNEKLLAWFKRYVNHCEVYASYKHWYPADNTLVVLISRRDKESPAEAARLFTLTVVSIILAELEARNQRTPEFSDKPQHHSTRDARPNPVRKRHRPLQVN